MASPSASPPSQSRRMPSSLPLANQGASSYSRARQAGPIDLQGCCLSNLPRPCTIIRKLSEAVNRTRILPIPCAGPR